MFVSRSSPVLLLLLFLSLSFLISFCSGRCLFVIDAKNGSWHLRRACAMVGFFSRIATFTLDTSGRCALAVFMPLTERISI